MSHAHAAAPDTAHSPAAPVSGHGDSHAHGDHGDGGAGDYNAQPPGPSSLPPVSVGMLAGFGIALTCLLSTLVFAALRLSALPEPQHRAPLEKHSTKH